MLLERKLPLTLLHWASDVWRYETGCSQYTFCVIVLSLLHTSRTKIQANKHHVQGEIPEYDGKNGLSAMCWGGQRNEVEWVQKVSTDEALLNLRQDVWLVCCRNSPSSKPYIAHRNSWAGGWGVWKMFQSPWSILPELSGLVVKRVVSDITARFYVSGDWSGIASLAPLYHWNAGNDVIIVLKNRDVNCIFFRKLFLCVIQNFYSSLAKKRR